MKKHDKLDCFVLVKAGEVISPMLTTTREYGAWFSSYFDSYTSGQELFCSAKTKDGNRVLESHPGTKIGKYFDTHSFRRSELSCWFIKTDNDLIPQLKWYGLADIADCTTNSYGRVLRVYTVQQIELYLQETVDRDFRLGNILLPAKKVQVNDPDSYIKPEHNTKKKTLF